jgi:hypothetical protein
VRHSTIKDDRMDILGSLKRILAGPQPEPVHSLGRNDRCWCGSNRKYKLCHMELDERKRSAARASTKRTSPARGF